MSAADAVIDGLALLLSSIALWRVYREHQERLRERAWLALAGDPPPRPLQTLRLGSSGLLVQHWQRRLRQRGYSLQVDGLFGDQTFSATRLFQESQGLAPDGIAGPNTWAAMLRCG